MNHHLPPPRVAPPPITLAEVELALLGIGSPAVQVEAPAKIADDALAGHALVITDPEGAPVTTVRVDAATESGLTDPQQAVLLSTVVTPAGDPPPDTSPQDSAPHDSSPQDIRPPGTAASGPYARLRRGPAQVRFDGAAAVVGHDPTDAYMLAAAVESGHPVVFIVLDGPRRQVAGPPAYLVARAALTLRDEIQAQGRAADVVVVPAPRYDDERDDALADTVAQAFGATRVHARRSPDITALRGSLDHGSESAQLGLDWPAASMEAWRRWRPPRSERGLVILFTGLSGSGKSTVARAVVDRIVEAGERPVTLLDGDVVRRNLSAGLGFSRADRDRNVERIGYVAAEIARHGGLAVCAPIAPFAQTRARVRRMAEEHGDFVLVHVATPLEECERRDRKGLYARARAGEIPDFTGISSPYEAPDDADLVLDTSQMTISDARDTVLEFLAGGGWVIR